MQYLEAKPKTIADLAKRLDMSVAQLKAPVRRLKDRNLAIDKTIDSKELTDLIKYYSASKIIPQFIYERIVRQYEEFKEICELSQIAAENNLNAKDLKKFCLKLDFNQRFELLSPNIFSKYENDTVKRTKVGELVNLYLKYKISMNKIITALVPEFPTVAGGKKRILIVAPILLK